MRRMKKIKKNKNIDVSIVSPTQAAVEQAKSEVRDMMDINRGRKRKRYQIGGKDRRKSKSRRSSFKKQKKKLIKKRQLQVKVEKRKILEERIQRNWIKEEEAIK